METKLKKSTFLSLFFFVLSLIIYFIPYILDTDHFRKFLSFLSLYIFYPSLLLSVIFSIRSFMIISNYKLKTDKIYVIINLLSIFFFIYFVIRMFVVLLKPQFKKRTKTKTYQQFTLYQSHSPQTLAGCGFPVLFRFFFPPPFPRTGIQGILMGQKKAKIKH